MTIRLCLRLTGSFLALLGTLPNLPAQSVGVKILYTSLFAGKLRFGHGRYVKYIFWLI